jgi:hypothetical protein
MNRKIYMISAALFALAILVTPVFAIGPEKTKNNPNVIIEDYGPALRLENGLANEWIIVTPVPQHHMIKSASDYQIKNAFVVTDPVLQYGQLENEWAYYSQEMFAQLLYEVFPFPEPVALQIAAMFPDGVYFRYVAVGQ